MENHQNDYVKAARLEWQGRWVTTPMIPSPNYQSRGNARVRLVVLHTAEGARDVTSLGNYLANPTVEASYHVAFDDNRLEQYVDYKYESWSTLSANPISDCGCMCGFAAWTRDQWLNDHPRMLELAAQWVASRCMARNVPVRRLSLSEVAACRNDPNHPGGVIGHIDWTRGAQDGTHTDPGDNFPWDWVINRARQIVGGPTRRRSIGDMGYIIEPTPIPSGAVIDTKPDGSWPAVQYTLGTPGPVGGWSGRTLMHFTPGYLGAFVQEAWSAPSGKHYVSAWDSTKKTGGKFVNSFVTQSWELSAGDKALIIRLATRERCSVTPETEH